MCGRLFISLAGKRGGNEICGNGTIALPGAGSGRKLSIKRNHCYDLVVTSYRPNVHLIRMPYRTRAKFSVIPSSH